MVITTDVLVVGGGGSGLAAALSARENGADVVLVEKARGVGGTTALSIGSITASCTPHQKRAGITDSPDAHYEDMPLFTPERSRRDNTALRRVLVDNVTDTLAWLEGFGLTFHGPAEEPPHRVARMHNVMPNSSAFIWVLERQARRRGIVIHEGVRALDLILENGRVCGFVAETAEGRREYRARRGVVLTTGDYSGGDELKTRLAPRVAGVGAINPGNTGDGQAMVERIGGRILNGDFVSGPTLRFHAKPGRSLLLSIPPYPVLTRAMKWALETLPKSILRPFILSYVTTFLAPEASLFHDGAMLVSHDGVRVPVDQRGPGVALAVAENPESYIVIDGPLTKKYAQWPHFISTVPNVAYAYLDDYRRMRPDLYRSMPTLEVLAASFGLAPSRLAEVMSTPEGTAARARPIEPPFTVLGPVRAWTILTDGGVAVDVSHRVLGADDRPFPGLYAAGSAGQGGLVLDGHGHHLGWAFTSGRRAGRFVAQEQQAL